MRKLRNRVRRSLDWKYGPAAMGTGRLGVSGRKSGAGQGGEPGEGVRCPRSALGPSRSPSASCAGPAATSGARPPGWPGRTGRHPDVATGCHRRPGEVRHRARRGRRGAAAGGAAGMRSPGRCGFGPWCWFSMAALRAASGGGGGPDAGVAGAAPRHGGAAPGQTDGRLGAPRWRAGLPGARWDMWVRPSRPSSRWFRWCACHRSWWCRRISRSGG